MKANPVPPPSQPTLHIWNSMVEEYGNPLDKTPPAPAHAKEAQATPYEQPVAWPELPSGRHARAH